MRGILCQFDCLRLTRAISLLVLYLASTAVTSEPLVTYSVADLLGGQQTTTRQFNQRFGFNANYNLDDLISTPQLNIDSVNGISFLSDWYPRRGPFRLSVGVNYQEKNSLHPVTALSSSQIVASSGLAGIYHEGISPYVGFGWGKNLKIDSQFDYNLDMGVLYQPDSSLLGQSGYSDSTGTDFSSQLREIDLSPIVSFGVSYNF